MKKIVVASHGCLAHELVNTSKMFADIKDVTSVYIDTGDDLNEFKQKMYREIIDNSYREVLVLVDLLGGTPFNTAVQIVYEYKGTKKIEIITGMNLPMLLEILVSHKETPLEDMIKPAVDAGREGIKCLSEEISKRMKGGEDVEHCAQQN